RMTLSAASRALIRYWWGTSPAAESSSAGRFTTRPSSSSCLTRLFRRANTECDAKYSATPGTEAARDCNDLPLTRFSHDGSSHNRDTVLSSRPDTKATSDMVKPASSVTFDSGNGLDQSIIGPPSFVTPSSQASRDPPLPLVVTCCHLLLLTATCTGASHTRRNGTHAAGHVPVTTDQATPIVKSACNHEGDPIKGDGPGQTT